MKYLLMLILPHILFNGCCCKQYRVSLVRLEGCKDPELPYANPLPYKLILDVFNSSQGHGLIMSGNLTVPKDIPAQDKRGTFSYGMVTSTGIKWQFTMKNLDCRGFVAKAMAGSFGFPLKGCVLKKGVYSFKDVNVDAMDTAFIAGPARVYGMFVSRTTIVSAKETLSCWVCHLKVAPLTKTRG